MKCLIKKFYKKELEEYTQILGSETAAYYLIAMNEGHTVDCWPDGSKSDTFEQLCEIYGYEQAVRYMYCVYSQDYLKSNNWVENFDLKSDTQKLPTIGEVEDAFASYFAGQTPSQEILQNDYFHEYFTEAVGQNQPITNTQQEEVSYAARRAVRKTREDYINQRIAEEEKKNIEKQIRGRNRLIGKVKKILLLANTNIIKYLSGNKKLKIRQKAYFEFNEYLKHALVQSIDQILGDYLDMNRNYHRSLQKFALENGDVNQRFINDLFNFLLQFYSGDTIQTSINKNISRYLFNEDDINEINQTYGTDFSVSNKDIENLLEKDKDKLTTDELRELGFVMEYLNKKLKKLPQGLINKILETCYLFANQDPINLCENQRIYDSVLKGYKSRLMSIDRTNVGSSQNTIQSIKLTIQKLEQLKDPSPQQLYNILTFVLDKSDNDLTNVLCTLTDYMNGTIEINGTQLQYILNDVIGFYDCILSDAFKNISVKNTGMTSDQIKILKQRYQQFSKELIQQTADAYSVACEKNIDKYIADFFEKQEGIPNKDQLVYRFKMMLLGKLEHGRISAFEQYFGDATQSSSIVIRTIQQLLNNVEYDINRKVNSKKHDLLGSFLKARPVFNKLRLSPVNPFMRFVETDSKTGLPTGNFIREYNYGDMNRDIKNAKERLAKKHGINLDSDYNPIRLYNNEEEKGNITDYLDELDRELEKYCNRRYTADYYIARRHYLSEDTQEKLDTLNKQIITLKRTATDDNGLFYPHMLSKKDRIKLLSVQQELDDLKNPYIITKDSYGNIVHVQQKTGSDLRIAEEIKAFNDYIYNNNGNPKIKILADVDKYNSAISKLTNQSDIDLFNEYNTMSRISPEFYERLGQLLGNDHTDAYLQAQFNISKIINTVKSKKGYYFPNLLQLSDEAFAEIHRNEEIKEQEKNQLSQDVYNELSNLCTQIAVTAVDPKTGNKRPVIDILMDQARDRELTSPGEIAKAESLYFKTITTKSGKTIRRPLSVFMMTIPVDTQRYVETVPCNDYSKASGEFINPDFVDYTDEEGYNVEQIQPKEYYRNDKFFAMKKNTNEFEFYKKLISTMDESLKMLPEYAGFNKYSLPKIRADRSDLGERFLRRFRIGSYLKSIDQDLFVTEQDTDIYREDAITRVNGTVVQGAPIRYISETFDPKEISCDLVYTVSTFYEMAMNFKEKSKVNPEIETLIDFMKSNEVSPNTVSQAETILDMYGYGHMTKGIGDDNKKMNKTFSFFTKQCLNIIKKTSRQMLSGNIISAAKGALSGWYQTWAQAFVGRQYDFGDRFWTTLTWIKEMPRMVASINSGNTVSKIQAAMQYNGLSVSKESVKNYNRLFRGRFKEYLAMWAFTSGDYSNTAKIMLSTYHAHRIVINPATGNLEVMNEEQYISACEKVGISQKNAIKCFDRNSSTNNLWEMYDITNTGDFVLKDKVDIKDLDGKTITIHPADYITSVVENRIAGGSEQVSSVVNGVVNPHGKNKLYQNPITKMFTLMKGFLFSQGWNRFKFGNDYENLYYDENSIRRFDSNSNVRGQYDFATGHVEAGVYSATGKVITHMIKYVIPCAFKSMIHLRRISTEHKLSRSDIQSSRQLIADIVGTCMFAALSVLTTMFVVRKFPDALWPRMLALIFGGAAIELATPFSMQTLSDIYKNLTVCQQVLDQHLEFFQTCATLMNLTNKDPYAEVERYAYKGNPLWFKIAMKNGGLVNSDVSMLKGYYETFAPSIPGLTSGKHNEYVKRQQNAIDAIKSGRVGIHKDPIEYTKTMSDILSTPLGVNGKYSYYNNNVWPMTMLPSLDPKKDSSKSKDKKKGTKKHKKVGKIEY